MAAGQLPNQIDGRQLEETVERLVAAIPDAVSRSVDALKGEDPRSFRSAERLDWQTKPVEIMRRINNDVRACGLLVTDPTQVGVSDLPTNPSGMLVN